MSQMFDNTILKLPSNNIYLHVMKTINVQIKLASEQPAMIKMKTRPVYDVYVCSFSHYTYSYVN